MKTTQWVAVTLNPAIDLLAQADVLATYQVNSVKEIKRYAAGKGINVGRVMSDLGADVTLTGFLGNQNSELFEALFESCGLSAQFVMVDGTNRTNIKIQDNTGDTTDINFNGFAVTQDNIKQLYKKLIELAEDHDGFIFSGSLAQNISEQTVVEWIKVLKQLGKKVVLDSSKQMLKLGIGAKPWMIKPNEKEVSDLLNREVVSIQDGVIAAQELVEQGIDNVLISMGEKGLIWASTNQVLITNPPLITPVSTVGAGDSVVAAFCTSSALNNPKRQIALATAMGALAVSQTDVGLPSNQQLEEMITKVTVEQVLG